jgi:hypothetical protein
MMRRAAVVGLAATALAVVPGVASAGGWATVGLSPTPKGMAAGEPWTVRLTVLQHGRTPLQGVHPQVIIQRGASKALRFQARPTKQPGVYSARVVFPTAGRWSYRVDDDFSQVHRFSPVLIARAAED